MATRNPQPATRNPLAASETRLENVQPFFGCRPIDVQRRKDKEHALLGTEQQPARATFLPHALGVLLVTNVHGDRQATPANLGLFLERHLAKALGEVRAGAVPLAQQAALMPFDPAHIRNGDIHAEWMPAVGGVD